MNPESESEDSQVALRSSLPDTEDRGPSTGTRHAVHFGEDEDFDVEPWRARVRQLEDEVMHERAKLRDVASQLLTAVGERDRAIERERATRREMDARVEDTERARKSLARIAASELTRVLEMHERETADLSRANSALENELAAARAELESAREAQASDEDDIASLRECLSQKEQAIELLKERIVSEARELSFQLAAERTRRVTDLKQRALETREETARLRELLATSESKLLELEAERDRARAALDVKTRLASESEKKIAEQAVTINTLRALVEGFAAFDSAANPPAVAKKRD